ncbi:MAG TPA: LamG domain-containing protein, partial [Gemmatimonadales bacterium]|nr:LamG domain-containing protein [Gemmatimonadales bacterium]
MRRKIARRSPLCAPWLLASAGLLPLGAADAGSIRFFGNGDGDIDRVKVRIDNPPGPRADIGASDFTIEFWIKGAATDNTNSVRCGSGVYGWIDGNIILDRDRFNLPRGFGLALGGGRVAFGANVDNMSIATHCGTRNVLDGQWHHVAVTRSSGGEIRLFVDGQADGSIGGVGGDLSYPDNGQPDPGNNCVPPGGGTPGPCLNSDPFIVLGAEKH